jgi:ribonuclease-3
MAHLWQKLTSLSFLRPDDAGQEEKAHTESSGAGPILAPDTAEYLERLTGQPCNHMIYRTALTHRSLQHDPHLAGQMPESNQRLEFLGDAVLDLLISEYLFKQFPSSDEGHLSNNRAKIVNRKSLAGFALHLGLGEHLIIGDSGDKQRIRTSESALADVFESLIGAIYLGQGHEGARRFIMTHIVAMIDLNRIVDEEYNHKSRLIEFTQSRQLPPPLYVVIAEKGAEHEKTFTIQVSCQNIALGQGTAPRKKDAEQIAAREAMQMLESIDPFPQQSEI